MKHSFVFRPSDPTSPANLDVPFQLLKGNLSCFSLYYVSCILCFVITNAFSCSHCIHFSGQKNTKDGSNKPPWLNITNTKVFSRFLLALQLLFQCQLLYCCSILVHSILQIRPIMFQDENYILEFETYPDLHACRQIIGKSHPYVLMSLCFTLGFTSLSFSTFGYQTSHCFFPFVKVATSNPKPNQFAIGLGYISKRRIDICTSFVVLWVSCLHFVFILFI